MDTIIAYPLNGIDYDAEDAQTYLCTRTSGVYSADDHFDLIAINGRTITIGPGLAWMKISRFGGISFAVTEAVDVTVEGPGDTPRTDLIVLQYDGNHETRRVICKRNSNSVEQSDGIFELALYRVQVDAGNNIILQTHIEDVRTTDLCGIMTDGVTKIPTSVLLENFETETQEAIQAFENNGNQKINTFSTDSNVAISNFSTDSNAAISNFSRDSNAAINDFRTSSQSDLDDFSNNTNVALTQFAQMSQRLESQANQVIAELQQTEEDYNDAVDAANGVVTNFTSVVIPDALSTFEQQKQEHFSDFVAEGDETILDFKERGDRALQNFDDTIADVASGSNVMLQTAFNPSGKVGQVAFADELSRVIVGGFIELGTSGIRNYFVVDLTTTEDKNNLIKDIKDGKNISIRLFHIRQAGELATLEEASNLLNYFLGNYNVPFETMFDMNRRTLNFYLQDSIRIYQEDGEIRFNGIYNDEKKKITIYPNRSSGHTGNIF